MKKLSYLFLAFAAMFIVACGGDSKDTSTKKVKEVVETVEEEIEEVLETVSDVIGGDIPGINDVTMSNNIDIAGTDAMQFDKKLFLVKAGETITLKLTHSGKMAIDVMGHDVVVLKPGSDVKAFGLASTKARAKDKTSTAMDLADLDSKFKNQILAETDMIGGGETTEITFTLEEGVYDFLCSFPAHYATMTGKIVARN